MDFFIGSILFYNESLSLYHNIGNKMKLLRFVIIICPDCDDIILKEKILYVVKDNEQRRVSFEI